MFHVDYERVRVDRVPVGIIASYPFTVDNVEFACNLIELSCELPDIQDVAVDLVEQEGIIPSAQGAFWMDFDTLQNIIAQTPYEPNPEMRFGYRHWIMIAEAICEIVAFHQEEYDCKFYFAEPANERLAVAYQRLIIPKLEKEGYNYYVDETEEGGWYVFHKQ